MALETRELPSPSVGLWRARALVTIVDLAWVLPMLWLVASLTGADGPPAALAFATLQPTGLLLGWAFRRLAAPRPLGIAGRAALGGLALALATWAGLYSSLPLLDAGWLRTALGALADTPYRLGPEPVLLPAGALLLLRGEWLAAHSPHHHTAGASFQAGLVAMAVAAVLGGERYALHALGWALAFLAVGLVALATARGDEAGARRDTPARLWAFGFTAVLLLLAFAMATGGGPFAHTLAELGQRALEACLGALNAFFAWLASLFPPSEPANLPPELAAQPKPPQNNGLRELLTVPESVRRVGAMAVMLGFVVPIVVAVVRYLGELWRRLTDPLFMSGVQVTAIEGTGWGLRSAMRSLVYRLGRLLWRGAGGRSLEGDPRAWPVRLAYRDLLRRAAKRGAVRPAHATAGEYLSTLSQIYPEHGDDLAEITRAYERARYGPAPERAEAADFKARLRRVTRRRWFSGKGGARP